MFLFDYQVIINYLNACLTVGLPFRFSIDWQYLSTMIVNSSKLLFSKFIEPFFHLIYCSGKILNVEVVDGGLICSSGVHVEEMGDKNDDCYIVNAAVYVGY